MPFDIGQLVALRADRGHKGTIIAVLGKIGELNRYRVFHSAKVSREYIEDQLIPEGDGALADHVAVLISANNLLETDLFRARLTAARLSNPQLDSIYALHAARIQFIPFQFKPLLRFLRADTPRLLIADEVGVGKTIEAGLILNELSARHRLKNVLVVCPKALTTKWQSELRRFDHKFQILDSRALKYCLQETFRDGVWPAEYRRAIVHLELLRRPDYLFGTKSRPGLAQLSPPPRFDFLIVDEAHHVRNTNTGSREAVRIICENSDAAVFLSATPVHVGSENLFSLLSLLRPETFIDFGVFAEMVQPNKHILEAIRCLRAGAGEIESAHQSLKKAAETSWGRRVLEHDPRFTRWRDILKNKQDLSDMERVQCLRDLEDTHTLSHVMNRTRRRDIGAFTIREPKTVTVEFTPMQKAFYEAVVAFKKDLLRLNHSAQVAALVADTLQRQAASCLPALVPAIESFLRTGRFDMSNLTDASEDETDETEIPKQLLSQAMVLRETARSLPTEDPKLQRLLEQIIKPAFEARPGKVLIFSFFLHTLNYLKSNIKAGGYRVALVTGQIDEEDRQVLRDRFRLPREDDDAIDVLLSSEVGCEGLDYEFCDLLVNYDIPWNPMRLEQRIGRIDRYGQKSEKVIIFNFVTPDTIDERIFFRCYDRLGVFKETIGDLEEILGETIKELTRAALDPGLSSEQLDEKVRQSVDNALRRADEQRRLEQEGSSILGLDQSLLQEVDELQVQGRFVSPEEIRNLVEQFLIREIGGRLLPDTHNKGIFKLKIPSDGRTLLLSQLDPWETRGHLVQEFQRWLEGADTAMTVTFDQAIAVANRNITFITPLHPLVRSAINFWRNSSESPIVSTLVVSEPGLKPGRYLFACDLWEYVAIRSELRLIGAVWSEQDRTIEPSFSSKLVNVLTRVTQPKCAHNMDEATVTNGLHQLDEYLENLRSRELVHAREVNTLVANRQLASLEFSFKQRIDRVQADIANSREDRITRMKESELSRLTRELEVKREQVLDKLDSDIITRRVAAGIIEVTDEDR